MGWYLLDHRNPHGDRFYPTRRQHIRLVVVHTAENLPDWHGEDTGAEAIARYAATTTRNVSWHASVDSDSIIPMLPDGYTAWHAAGYNSPSLGMELATQAHRWGDGPADWERDILTLGAEQVRSWCLRHGIPMDRITRADADAGRTGIVAHADLDPTRRSDPGINFPWDRFLSHVRRDPEEADDMPVCVKLTDKDATIYLHLGDRLAPLTGDVWSGFKARGAQLVEVSSDDPLVRDVLPIRDFQAEINMRAKARAAEAVAEHADRPHGGGGLDQAQADRRYARKSHPHKVTVT